MDNLFYICNNGVNTRWNNSGFWSIHLVGEVDKIYWTAKETSRQITESQTFILKYNKHKLNSFYIVWMVDLLLWSYIECLNKAKPQHVDALFPLPLITSMSTTSVYHSSTSSIHRVDKAIDECHRNKCPNSLKRHRKFSCSCRAWLLFIQPSLNFIPQMFNRV